MRVLTFLHSFEPGGVERVALRLCKAWSASGIDSTLIMGRADGAMHDQAEGLAYEVLSDGRFPTASWETLWMILRLPAVIRRVRPDVLFCAGNSYSVVSVAMKLLLRENCPPIVAKISNDLARKDMPAPFRWCYHRWLRIQARYIDCFVGMAPPMRTEIAAATGIDPAKVAIVDDPSMALADVARLSQRPADPLSRTRLVAAGRLAPQKNFPLMLAAFARAAHANDTLTVLGEGPERSRIEREAARLGIAHKLHLLGHVADLAPWFADSDIFVLSSDYEGVPAVIAEALAAGLAIVATDCSVSMADMLGDGAFGLLTPVGDAGALAAAIGISRTRPLDRLAMRKQAERFTVENAAARYLDIFAETAKLTSSQILAKDAPSAVRRNRTGVPRT